MLKLTGVMLASCYALVKLYDDNSVQNIQGVLYFMISELVFTNMYSVLNIFPAEVAIFLKEKTLYSSHSYFVSKILSLVPTCLLTSATYCGLFFLTVNFLKGYVLWLQMTYIIFLTSIASCGLGKALILLKRIN